MSCAFNLASHFLSAAEAIPDKLALAIVGPTSVERWSCARLVAGVRGAATGLLRAGLRPGDRILLRLGNTPAFPVAYLGAIAAGIVQVLTSSQLTAPEASLVAATTDPRLILGPGSSVIAAFWTGSASKADLAITATAHLARYKQPRLWLRVDVLPRTPTGKVSRRALREAHRRHQ